MMHVTVSRLEVSVQMNCTQMKSGHDLLNVCFGMDNDDG